MKNGMGKFKEDQTTKDKTVKSSDNEKIANLSTTSQSKKKRINSDKDEPV